MISNWLFGALYMCDNTFSAAIPVFSKHSQVTEIFLLSQVDAIKFSSFPVLKRFIGDDDRCDLVVSALWTFATLLVVISLWLLPKIATDYGVIEDNTIHVL